MVKRSMKAIPLINTLSKVTARELFHMFTWTGFHQWTEIHLVCQRSWQTCANYFRLSSFCIRLTPLNYCLASRSRSIVSLPYVLFSWSLGYLSGLCMLLQYQKYRALVKNEEDWSTFLKILCMLLPFYNLIMCDMKSSWLPSIWLSYHRWNSFVAQNILPHQVNSVKAETFWNTDLTQNITWRILNFLSVPCFFHNLKKASTVVHGVLRATIHKNV